MEYVDIGGGAEGGFVVEGDKTNDCVDFENFFVPVWCLHKTSYRGLRGLKNDFHTLLFDDNDELLE